jgi:hypothetical protein
MDQHPILLQKIVNYARKNFITSVFGHDKQQATSLAPAIENEEKCL